MPALPERFLQLDGPASRIRRIPHQSCETREHIRQEIKSSIQQRVYIPDFEDGAAKGRVLR